MLATYIAHRAPRSTVAGNGEAGSFGLPGLSGGLFQEIVTKYPQKTVVIALGSPYLIESFLQIQTYICTYAMASTSEISAIKALFGESKTTRHSQLHSLELPNVDSLFLGRQLVPPSQQQTVQ